MKLGNFVILSVLCISLSGCQHLQSMSSKDMATAIGATVGGVGGYMLGGKHKDLWTVGGVAAGAFVGNRIGQYLDETSKQKMEKSSQKAIVTGKSQDWSNPNQGVSGHVEVVEDNGVRSTDGTANKPCRTVRQTIWLKDGTETSEDVTACQGANGWEMT